MRLFTHRMKSASGFSLSEVAITMAIMGIVTLGVGTLIVQQSKQTSATRRVSTANEIALSISGYLSNPEICGRILQTHFASKGIAPGVAHSAVLTTAPAADKEIDISAGPDVNNSTLKVNANTGATGLSIETLDLTTGEIEVIQSSNGTQVGKKMRGTLTLRFGVPGDQLGGDLAERKFAITYSTNNSGEYYCDNLSSYKADQEILCRDMGGYWTGTNCEFCENIGGYYPGYIPTPGGCQF